MGKTAYTRKQDIDINTMHYVVEAVGARGEVIPAEIFYSANESVDESPEDCTVAMENMSSLVSRLTA